VNAVAIGRVGDRDLIITGSGDRTVRIWDAITGGLVGTSLTGHSRPVSAVAIGRDLIISGSYDRTVRIWDAVTGGPLATLAGHDDYVYAVAIGRAGDRDVIVSSSRDRAVLLYERRPLDSQQTTRA
jgi:WD40 repeat protein